MKRYTAVTGAGPTDICKKLEKTVKEIEASGGGSYSKYSRLAGYQVTTTPSGVNEHYAIIEWEDGKHEQ